MDIDRELNEIHVNLSYYLTENTTPTSYLHRKKKSHTGELYDPLLFD